MRFFKSLTVVFTMALILVAFSSCSESNNVDSTTTAGSLVNSTNSSEEFVAETVIEKVTDAKGSVVATVVVTKKKDSVAVKNTYNDSSVADKSVNVSSQSSDKSNSKAYENAVNNTVKSSVKSTTTTKKSAITRVTTITKVTRVTKTFPANDPAVYDIF